MKKGTVFKGGLLPAGGNETRQAEFAVEEGRFVAFGESIAARPGDSVVDLGGRLVLPGAIDGHVHYDDPGFTHREDFGTGTRAAAAGGVTCVVDMPCTSLPPVTTVVALRNKLAIVAPKAHVDFMLWGGVSGNSVESPAWRGEVRALAAEGVAAFKLYLLSGMETFRDVTEEQAREALVLLAGLGVPAGFHAEDKALVERLTAELRAGGRRPPLDLLDYADSRPAEAEARAVAFVVCLARETGGRVHVVHLGASAALEEVRRARSSGLAVSAETCPHYLAFTRDDLSRMGSLLKTAPVIKGEADREALWRGLADGTIQHVATDHAPAQWPREKMTGSAWTDYGGVPGTELMLPYLWSEGVRAGRITLERMTELLSSAPARFFGIAARKGRLATGVDADFVLLDPDAAWRVDPGRLHNKNRYSPFAGRTLTGRVVATYVRGSRVYAFGEDGGETFGPPGEGRFVRRGESA